MENTDPTYDDTVSNRDNEGKYVDMEGLQLRDVVFHNPQVDPGSHYQSLDDAHGRTDTVYINPQVDPGNHYQSLENADWRTDNVYMGLDNTQSSQSRV